MCFLFIAKSKSQSQHLKVKISKSTLAVLGTHTHNLRRAARAASAARARGARAARVAALQLAPPSPSAARAERADAPAPAAARAPVMMCAADCFPGEPPFPGAPGPGGIFVVVHGVVTCAQLFDPCVAHFFPDLRFSGRVYGTHTQTKKGGQGWCPHLRGPPKFTHVDSDC